MQENPTSYRLLKAAQAPKVGQRASGKIGYEVITDPEHKRLWLRITSNESGGYFSRELILFARALACLPKAHTDEPFPSKTFASAFDGRSANNAGFLAAILRAEGLLVPAPDNAFLHLRIGDWNEWKKALLVGQSTELLIVDKSPTAGERNSVEQTDSTESNQSSARNKAGNKDRTSKQGENNEDHT